MPVLLEIACRYCLAVEHPVHGLDAKHSDEEAEMPALSGSTMRLLAVVGLYLISGGCADLKVPLPSSDSTAPDLRWTVFELGSGTSTDFAATGGVVHAGPGQTFRVTLTAHDSGGVKHIELGSGGTYTCIQGGQLAQTASFSGGTDVQDLTPDASNMVLSSIFLIRNADPNWDCNSGFVFQQGSIALIGKAQNYYAGTAMGDLSIVRP